MPGLDGLENTYARALYRPMALAADGGPIALLRDGDEIEIDIANRRLDVLLDETELARRRDTWQPPALKATGGFIDIYRRCVGGADTGAVMRV